VTTAQGRRHPYRPSGAALARVRLAVYTRDNFRCVRCGWQPPDIPQDYDGSRTLGTLEPRAPSTRNPLGTIIRRLELGHIIRQQDGGTFTIDNLQAECSPCNRGHRVTTPMVPDQQEVTS
jgi:5-methylcytosine-specific restriction endonuclease McrA